MKKMYTIPVINNDLPARNTFVLVLFKSSMIQFLLLKVWEEFWELFKFAQVRNLKYFYNIVEELIYFTPF